jgi:hypothetical protein
MSAQVTSQISLDDPASGNHKVVQDDDQKIELDEKFKEIWTAISRLKENKVEVDVFETKMFEIEKELQGEEDVLEKLQGQLKGPKR